MVSVVSFLNPRMAMPVSASTVAGTTASVAAASFEHALVALSAKLASVDGTPNTSEYAAFHALFVGKDVARANLLRSLFIKRVTDTSSALQYAREIAAVTHGDSATRAQIFDRLLSIATADAAINAAEIELLRAVADIFGMTRETFRARIATTLVPVGASPYDVLGVSPRVSDQELRDHYMARVQMLHPDRYHAAGASAETIAMLSDQLAAVNAAYRAAQTMRAKKAQRVANRWWNRTDTKGVRLAT